MREETAVTSRRLDRLTPSLSVGVLLQQCLLWYLAQNKIMPRRGREDRELARILPVSSTLGLVALLEVIVAPQCDRDGWT